MSPKYLATAALSIAGIALLLYIVLGKTPLVPLVELGEVPQPPVHADKQTKPQLLSGLHDPFNTEGARNVANVKRRARNELARRHIEAIALWREGRQSLREVESIEQMLWVARVRTGEVTKQEMHENLARLFERELQRVEALAERGFAGQDAVERTRLFLARELYLAGRADSDPRAAAYPEARLAYLDSVKQLHETRIRTGIGRREQLAMEFERLEGEFGPLPTPPPSPENLGEETDAEGPTDETGSDG